MTTLFSELRAKAGAKLHGADRIAFASLLTNARRSVASFAKATTIAVLPIRVTVSEATLARQGRV